MLGNWSLVTPINHYKFTTIMYRINWQLPYGDKYVENDIIGLCRLIIEYWFEHFSNVIKDLELRNTCIYKENLLLVYSIPALYIIYWYIDLNYCVSLLFMLRLWVRIIANKSRTGRIEYVMRMTMQSYICMYIFLKAKVHLPQFICFDLWKSNWSWWQQRRK